MSKHYALTANKRDRAGKGVARALRREKRIPAVVYGDHKAPVLISCLEKDVFLQFQKGGMKTHMCDLSIDGDKATVVARDIQLNPVTDRIEHIDFMRVGAKTKLTVSVPLHFMNQEKSPGIKSKGILNVVHHHLEIRCAAGSIPESIDIDMGSAELNHVFKLKDVALPKGVEVMGNNDPDMTLANIVEPTVKAEPVEGEAPAAAAPEAAASAAPAEKK